MAFKIRSIGLFFCVMILSLSQSNAQSVRGKVIYISSSQEVKFRFRSAVENYSFVNKYESGFFKVKASHKNFEISSLAENFKATNLVVTEGENTHLFILSYKDKLDEASETLYDFSSKEKLQLEMQKMTARKTNVPVPNTEVKYTPATPIPAVVIQTTNTVEPIQKPAESSNVQLSQDLPDPKPKQPSPPATDFSTQPKAIPVPVNATSYSTEIANANKSFQVREYAKARYFFQSAQKFDPSAKYPAIRIAEIDSLLWKENNIVKSSPAGPASIDKKTMHGRLETSQNNTAIAAANEETVAGVMSLDSLKYEIFIHLADSTAWIAKDYKKALHWYDSAQKIKPNAFYPKKQVKAVTQLQSEKEVTEARQRRKDVFNNALTYYRKADTLRIEREYEESHKNYNEFLSRVDTVNAAEYNSSQLHYIKEAKDYVSRLQNYLPKPRVEPVAPVVAGEKPKKKRKGK